MRHNLLSIVLLSSLAACADKSDADFRTEVAASMHTSITTHLAALVAATRQLQVAAPDRAWNAAANDAAIGQMRDAWRDARVAWENIEGAIAPMFAGLNQTMDARYEEFLPDLGPRGDQNLFDDDGVIGMHAVERILFAPYLRPEVVMFESSLPGYKPAAFPATDDEAIAFKTQLAQRLVDDATELASSWRPDDVDIATAYKGLVDLMVEQPEKVILAVTGEQESRYSNYTLLDMRNNLSGTHQVYNLFREWIQSKASSSAQTADQEIIDKFEKLMTTYQTTPGDALPDVPKDWSSDNPSPDALRSAFGALWLQVRDYGDPMNDGSVVHDMNRIATLLGFSQATGIDQPPGLHLRRAHSQR